MFGETTSEKLVDPTARAPSTITNIHTVPAITEEASGPSYSVLRLCESLQDQGQAVTLAALDWNPRLRSPTSFLKTFPVAAQGPLRRLGNSQPMKRWLREQAAAGKVDLLHSHSLWMMPNVYPGSVARNYEIPLVVSPRGTLSEYAFSSGSALKRVFWHVRQARAVRAATCFHATGEAEYQDIRRMGFRQPVAIIPNGIDIRDLPEKRERSRRTLLFLGRLHPIKGVDLLLHAWRAVQDRCPDWDLRIVGPSSDNYRSELQLTARLLGVKRTAFEGPVFGERKMQAMREADLFVLPTRSDNFGVAVAEALSVGTPAIVTKAAPWRGLEKAGAGLWIDVGVDALIAALEKAMAAPPSDLSEMGMRGRAWMRSEFSWSRIGEHMAETYNWVRNGGSCPVWVKVD